MIGLNICFLINCVWEIRTNMEKEDEIKKKGNRVTFFDVIKRHGKSLIILSVGYFYGVSMSDMPFLGVILFLLFGVGYVLWLLKHSTENCSECYSQFLPPSKYEDRKLCQNCLLEKTKDLWFPEHRTLKKSSNAKEAKVE